ncbi:MAG: hypothetical protein ACEPOW_02840 [Bacteroidales bacterium]
MNNNYIKIWAARIICGLFFCLFFTQTKAQQRFLSLSQEYNTKVEQLIDNPEHITHPSIRPYRIAEINKLDSTILKYSSFQKKNPFSGKISGWAFNRLFNKNFFEINKKDVHFVVNPLINFSGGRDFQTNTTLWTNSRGIEIYGDLGKNFSFYTSFHETQGLFPEYENQYIRKNRIIPGLGLSRKFEYGEGYDYSWATGYISYTPNKFFNIQFGTGKNFFGNGYRSMILSDNAFSYPFLKVETTFWRIKYINLYTELQDINYSSKRLGYAKKYTTMHYLDYAVNKRLNIGIFETIVFQAKDTTGYRGFDMGYLNPIIFYRPVEYSRNSPDNALLGLNISYKLSKGIMLYGQAMLDEFRLMEITSGKGWWANKQGYQLGVKVYDAFKVKNLFLQSEFNMGRPYLYSHWDGLQAYGHLNAPLAHTLGANFRESVNIIKYNYQRWFLRYEFMYALFGDDQNEKSFGRDVFRSYLDRDHNYGVYIGQGNQAELYFQRLKLSYLFNRNYNLNAFIDLRVRSQAGGYNSGDNTSISVGIATSLENVYNDF